MNFFQMLLHLQHPQKNRKQIDIKKGAKSAFLFEIQKANYLAALASAAGAAAGLAAGAAFCQPLLEQQLV